MNFYLQVKGKANSNMEPHKQSSKSNENESSAEVDGSEINKIASNVNVAPEAGNTVHSGNKVPDEASQTENLNANNAQQISTDTLEKDLALLFAETAENPPSCSTSTNSTKKVQILSEEVITVNQLLRHSKPFKKRSLSVDSSRGLNTEPVKRPKQTPVQETVQDASMPTVTSNSEEKITPIQLSKVKAGPKPEYTIKNSNTKPSQPVASSPKEARRSSISNEIDDTLEMFESLCQQISVMNKHTKSLSDKFKELTTSLDENITSSEKMYSLVDDLMALYSDDFNDSNFDYDRESDTSGSDEDGQNDYSKTMWSESASRTDTKWTLKYQGKEFDTTELMPGSGVYVSRIGLVKCRNLAQSPIMLAKMLMTEIFTKQALLECSFSGVCVKFNGVARPPLDRDGAIALLEFVRQFSEENRWEVRDHSVIRKNITAFLSRFRKQYFY